MDPILTQLDDTPNSKIDMVPKDSTSFRIPDDGLPILLRPIELNISFKLPRQSFKKKLW